MEAPWSAWFLLTADDLRKFPITIPNLRDGLGVSWSCDEESRHHSRRFAMLHPDELYTIARHRQDELIASARSEQIAAPRQARRPQDGAPLRALWLWLCARVVARQPPARRA